MILHIANAKSLVIGAFFIQKPPNPLKGELENTKIKLPWRVFTTNPSTITHSHSPPGGGLGGLFGGLHHKLGCTGSQGKAIKLSFHNFISPLFSQSISLS